MRDEVSGYLSRGASQVREMTRNQEGTAVLVAFGAGLGVGFLIGRRAGGSFGNSPRSWSDRMAAEGHRPAADGSDRRRDPGCAGRPNRTVTVFSHVGMADSMRLVKKAATMTSYDPADDIRRRMAELRRELTGDVREVGRSAREMTDWTFYVRKFPWAVAAVAAVTGLYVGAEEEADHLSRPGHARRIGEEATIAGRNGRPSEIRQDLLKSLVVMGLTWGRSRHELRGAALSNAADKTQPEAAPTPAPSPLEATLAN